MPRVADRRYPVFGAAADVVELRGPHPDRDRRCAPRLDGGRRAVWAGAVTTRAHRDGRTALGGAVTGPDQPVWRLDRVGQQLGRQSRRLHMPAVTVEDTSALARLDAVAGRAQRQIRT